MTYLGPGSGIAGLPAITHAHPSRLDLRGLRAGIAFLI